MYALLIHAGAETVLSLASAGSGSVHVHNLEEIIVKDAPEIYSVLDRGAKRRTSAETLLNKLSSRSHSVFTITIHMRDVTPEGEVRPFREGRVEAFPFARDT